MATLIGRKKVRTAVFISGTGSNLKNLIDFSKLKHLTIYDGRNILNRAQVEDQGIDYFGIGT